MQSLKSSLKAVGSPFVEQIVDMLREFQSLAAPAAPVKPNLVMTYLQVMFYSFDSMMTDCTI